MNQPIEILVDDQIVTGEITFRTITDIGIIITSPYTGFCSGSHIPNIARGAHPRGFTDEYGDIRARQLLESLYSMLKDFNDRKDDLRELVKPYKHQVEAVDPYTKEEYMADRREIRRRFRSGEIDNKQHGKEQMEIKRRLSRAEVSRMQPKIHFLMDHMWGKATICDLDWMWKELVGEEEAGKAC